jgi:hypothetical protein
MEIEVEVTLIAVARIAISETGEATVISITIKECQTACQENEEASP